MESKLLINTLHYIKLHGSFDWKSSDGTDRLVIGKKKEDQIAREPLLSSYFDLFKKVLLLDVFPSDPSKSHAWKEIKESYFELNKQITN